MLERRPLTVAEAVAVTAQICAGQEGQPFCVPTPSGLLLNEDGTLSLEGCAEVAEPSKTAALARFLRRVLPPRAPAPLLLAVARAAGELTLPPFDSTDGFVASLARFTDRDPREVVAALYREVAGGVESYEGIDDVRRARRASRIPLAAIARESGIPIYILRQLEWGDFREWRNDDWALRAARAYARAARINADAVIEMIQRERHAQLHQAPSADPLDRLLVRAAASPAPAASGTPPSAERRQVHAWPLAAAAVIAVIVSGGTLIHRIERTPSQNAPAVTATPAAIPTRAIAAPPAHRGDVPAPELAPAPAATDWRAQDQPPTRPVRATSGDEPAFSPSFSSAGSAMFSQRGAPGESSALVRADRDSLTNDLRVMRIVDDGARNYHVRPSPDGQRIAFDSDRDGERGVYIASSTGTDVHRVSGPGFAAIPSWSPDGTRLAFVREGRSSRVWDLWLLDLQSNDMKQLTDFAYGQAWGGSWFPDGKRIAYSHEDQLVIANLESGSRSTIPAPRHGALLRTPSVSPDGRHIAFQVHRNGAWLLDLNDGSMRRILEDPTAEEFAWDAAGRRLAFHSRRSGTWSIWIMAPEAN